MLSQGLLCQPNICNEKKAAQQFGRQFTKFCTDPFEALDNFASVYKRCYSAAGSPSVPIGAKRRVGSLVISDRKVITLQEGPSLKVVSLNPSSAVDFFTTTPLSVEIVSNTCVAHVLRSQILILIRCFNSRMLKAKASAWPWSKFTQQVH